MSIASLVPSTALALQWPVEPVLAAPGLITQLGDWDGSGFHRAIDIPREPGTTVRSVEDGCVVGIVTTDPALGSSDLAIVVAQACGTASSEGWAYMHILNTTGLTVGDSVTVGQKIGEASSRFVGSSIPQHLHFGRQDNPQIQPNLFTGQIPRNPLLYYEDNLPASIALLDQSAIFFVPDQMTNLTAFTTIGNRPVIFNNVDVFADAHNKVVNETRPGVYSISFAVSGGPPSAAGIAERTLVAQRQMPFSETYSVATNSPGPKFFLVYAAGSTDFQGRYIVTNAGTSTPLLANGVSNVIENAWFTRVRAGVDDSAGGITAAQMARSNVEARFPDGIYQVKVNAGTFLNNHVVTQTRDVLVDNFRPFFASAVIGSPAKFSKQWNWNGTQFAAGPITNEPFGAGSYPLTLVFSEPITAPSISFTDSGIRVENLTSTDPADAQLTFTATLVVDPSAADGSKTMTVSAKDGAGNDLLALGPGDTTIDPATRLARDAAGILQGVGGSDISLRLTVDSALAYPLVDIPGLFPNARGPVSRVPSTSDRAFAVTIRDEFGFDPQGLVFPGNVTVTTPEGHTLASLPAGTKHVVLEVSGLTPGVQSFSVTNTENKTTSGSWQISSLLFEIGNKSASYNSQTGNITGSIQVNIVSNFGVESFVETNQNIDAKLNDFGTETQFTTTAPTDRRFLHVRDKDGNGNLYGLAVEESFASTRSLLVSGSGSDSATLSLTGENAAGDSFLPMGVVHQTSSTPVASVGTAYDGTISLPISEEPISESLGTYSITIGGMEFMSSEMTAVPERLLTFTDSVVFSIVVNSNPQTAIYRGDCPTPLGNTCPDAPRRVLAVGMDTRAMALKYQAPSWVGNFLRIFPGPNQIVSLGNGIQLTKFSPTEAVNLHRAFPIHQRVEPPYTNALGNLAYIVAADPGVLEIGATLNIPIASTAPTGSLELARIIPCLSDLADAELSGSVAKAPLNRGGTYTFVSNKYENPIPANGAACRFMSQNTGVIVSEPPGDPRTSQALNVFDSLGLKPLIGTCTLGPTGEQFSPAGTLKVCFDPETPGISGLSDSAFTLYQFNGDGVREELSGQFLDRERGIITGNVDHLSSQFNAFTQGTPGTAFDLLPPITTLQVNGTEVSGTGQRVIKTTAAITLIAVDPPFPGAPTSGVSGTFVLIDEAFLSTTATPGTAYAEQFNLGLGTHTVMYYSVDVAGNVETTLSADFRVEQALLDVQPPRTTFVVSPPSTTVGGLFVSSMTPLGFSVFDDRTDVGDGLGFDPVSTYYSIDGGPAALFTSSFTLVAEGTRTVSFFSVDLSSNAETAAEWTLFADLTPPVSQVSQNDVEVSIEAFDPNGGGANSGVARIRYLVDYGNPDVCNNIPEDPGFEPGTCENPWYAGPFTLPSGEHPIHFQAFDNVGNAEALQTILVNVDSGGGGDGDGTGGLGIGKDPSDEFWSVFAADAAISFAHSDSSGALISSTSLQDAADGLPWSVFFNTLGRAYAIGMAEGPATQAIDLAIYKASPSGDAIESRTLFDSGYASNELVFDAKAPGWIAGAAQTAGPADFDAEGERSFSLALWRFDPALGSVVLSTSTTRSGFDFGSGLAVDADGSLWIIGYSLRPDDPEVGALDLALRHYAADGQTLLGGPYFMPGYLDHFDGPVTAKVHVTADAVYVAAPRRNGSDGFDMAFLKFDKATGAPLVEKIWRAEGGAASYPIAVLPEAGGLLIVGGIGAEATEAGLWRFGYDGGFLNAATAGAGAAKGAVFNGTELWLSVEGATEPYRVTSESPAAGSVIDISTPAAPAGFAVNPATGPIGIPFTIAGAGFGPYAGGNTRVKFGTVVAPLSLWNDTTIKGTVPGQSTGTYAVGIERQNASSVTAVSAGDFIVTDLNAAVLNISSGPIGVPFTIAGAGFGPYAGTLSRVLVDGATAPLSVWNDTTISGTIPGVMPGAKTIVIQRAAGAFLSTSDGFAFTVTVPSVTLVSPSSAPIGAIYTLTGFSFGPYAGANTRVLIGGATTALSLWSDRTIRGTVPGTLAPGVQTVIVERRTADGGLVQSGTAYFQVAGLMVSSLTPSSGPIGIPFTISGAGFGAYDGANTRVKFGVSTAALSLWNDTTIKGTIPALEAGDWSVTVERQQGASVASVSAGTFTATAPSVDGIAPSSGPIGAPFTITGSQFGVYGGANTRVTFNGVLAPLSLWNDTTITGTVPALSTGAVDVVVERQQGAEISSSMVASFTVVELASGGMTPVTGPIGTVFTITGTGFGPYAGGNTRVLIGGTTAALSLWNDTTITGTIPNLPAGAQPLWIERAAGTGVQSSATAYFEVTVPAVSSLSPSSAPIGAPFTITGTSFGAYAGANTRVLFNGVSAALSLWNDTQITGTVPALPAGEVSVIVERLHGGGGVESGSVPFTVLAPSADPVSPVSGPIGTVFTLTGSGFGPYAGANTRVLIGGATAALSLWNDTTIKGTIPALPSGVQAVWLERSAGSGVSSSATSYFTVTTPEVASLTPSSAPIGAPFTITGASFGAYAGANTRVTFNGMIAPLSVWNDTQITGIVPGALPPGEAVLVVERAAGGGLAVSATQAFFVIVPAISTITPAYGTAGTVVTVTGTGFGPYSGTLTKLLVGGSTVPLSVWNDTMIRWTVPASLGDGEHPVIVERSPAGGTVQSASATFTVGSPAWGGESFAFSATLSLAATPDENFEGGMSLSSTTGGRIDTPAKAAVDIPANAMDADTEITLKRIVGDGRREDAAQEIKMRAAGEPIEFGPAGTRFATPVTIELPYDPALAGDEDEIAIHYYNPLRREWEELPSVVDRARKVVTAQTDHFSIYQPMGLAPTTVAQDEFYFRDAYAFPNPSRSGAAVTFRIQPGLAETVELRVYDLSGRRIHSSSDFTFRGAIDDGNGKGAQNTYDHVWGVGGVGSGVYRFVIKASQRGHKPITKNGKVGVIR